MSQSGMASQAHTGQTALPSPWQGHRSCLAPSARSRDARCPPGARALPHAPASTCPFPPAPHRLLRPSFPSTAPPSSPPAGTSTLQASPSNTTLTVFPHKLHISPPPLLRLTPRCSSPPMLAAAADSRPFQDKVAQSRRAAAGPLRGAVPPRESRMPGMGTREPSPGAELGHRCRQGEMKGGLGPWPPCPARARHGAVEAPAWRGFLRLRGCWPAAPLWQAVPTRPGPASRAQPRLLQPHQTRSHCWASWPS